MLTLIAPSPIRPPPQVRKNEDIQICTERADRDGGDHPRAFNASLFMHPVDGFESELTNCLDSPFNEDVRSAYDIEAATVRQHDSGRDAVGKGDLHPQSPVLGTPDA